MPDTKGTFRLITEVVRRPTEARLQDLPFLLPNLLYFVNFIHQK